MRFSLKFSIRVLLFPLLVLFVASKLNVDDFFESFWLIESKYFLYAIAYFLVYPWFGILRWKKLVSICYQIRFLKAAKIYFYGEGLNLILPSKLGDLSKAVFLKSDKICPLPYANGTVIYEKILDLLSIVTIFVLSFLSKGELTLNNQYQIFTFIFVLLLCIVIIFNLHRIGDFIENLAPLEYRNIVISILDFLKFFKILKQNFFSIFLFLFFSILFWAGHIFQIYLFILAANIDITYSQVLLYIPVVLIISLIPVSIAGFGTREISLLYFFEGITSPENIVLASLMISLRYFIPGFFGASLLLLFGEKPFTQKKG